MIKFEEIKSDDSVNDILKGTFNLELPISGGWGYSELEMVEILNNSVPKEQLQYMFGTARSTIEMSLTQPKENRYAGINLKEISREEEILEGKTISKVKYEISAILEDIYNEFISEYKENHGKDDFDIASHFKQRDEKSIKLEKIIYFKQ
ncbi:MAG: hypothetical protein U9Q30_05120 [Campylobacterota bacterium]|nr:hypothetical protein [Campylobacterota bacterium]